MKLSRWSRATYKSIFSKEFHKTMRLFKFKFFNYKTYVDDICHIIIIWIAEEIGILVNLPIFYRLQ